MTLRKDKVDGRKRNRFLLKILLITVIGIGAWYLIHALNGVLGRSSASVSNSEWVSWNVGTLYFGETTGNYNDSTKSTFFRFEERGGAVKIIVNEELFMALVRFDENKLMTSDGKSVFYYKGAWDR